MTLGGDMRAAVRRGAERLADEARGRVAAFVESCRASDGGFRGRSTEPDLYYTLFGLECLAAFDRLPASGRVAGLSKLRPYGSSALPSSVGPDVASGLFLASFGPGERLDLIHLVSLIRCRVLLAGGALAAPEAQPLAAALARFRAPDGGYRLASGSGESSVYAAFLAAGALDDLGAELPDPGAVARSVAGRAAPDGGFAGGPGIPGSTTTVTAAAIVLLLRLGCSVPAAATRWLRAQAVDGGFRAAAGAPVPDLLSTASALFALSAAGESLADLRPASQAFVESLWLDSGGFAGSAADPVADCEYTFYALLALGVLSP